jgi:Arrestin (or S-antigen), N-terminal domain
MIFNKILKGTDLTFDMSLEKTEYRPGEIVRGKLSLKTEKSCKARKLMFFAEGKESTIISISESTGYGSNRDTTTRTYSEINTFFSKDLSPLLESVSSNILQDGTLEILPQNKEIAFDFILPTDNNLFSSYKGKHANITYTVKATADIAKKLDVNKEEQFHVINSNNKVVAYSSNTSFNEDNTSDTINSTTIIENKNNISQSPTIEKKKKNTHIRKDTQQDLNKYLVKNQIVRLHMIVLVILHPVAPV